MTERALASLAYAAEGLDLETILIENGSIERVAAEAINKYNLTVINNSENLGFAKAVNQGIGRSGGEFILLLNSDVLLEKSALQSMLARFETGEDNSGIIGPKLVYPTGKVQATFGKIPTLANELLRFSMFSKILPWGTLTFKNYFTDEQFSRAHEVAWLSGGCMLIKRAVIDKIGLFDEAFRFGVEDIDFCLRADKADFSVIYESAATAIHHHGYSSGGKRSLWSATNEMNGFVYLISKHWPQKKLFLFLERVFYRVRIFKYRIFD